MTDRFDGGIISHPKRIGHIKFIGFDQEDRMILETLGRMKYERINGELIYSIDYYSSNLSEELIDSMTIEGFGYKYYRCTNKKIFNKIDYDNNYFESAIIEITVLKDDNNSILEIGDKINKRTTRLGEG